MSRVFHVDGIDAEAHLLTPKQLLKEFLSKAGEYLDGLMLETGLKLEPATLETLKMALLEDFIEVHNAAIKQAVALPEDKASVEHLLSR